MPSTIDITVHSPAENLDRQKVRTHVRRMLKALGHTHYSVSLLFCGDDEMREINSQYRNLSRTTNVLSFVLAEGDGLVLDDCLGDVVVNVEAAVRQSLVSGQSFETELLDLVRHGVWHLLGYNHSKGDVSAWHQRDHELLAQIMPNKQKGGG